MEESILMWNRLEGTLRNEAQLDQALAFEVRDALWMLTRQWQFGEFEGEDAGTAAFAQIQAEHAPVTHIGGPGEALQPFDFRETPFELSAERQAFVPHIAARIEMGRHWERILAKRLGAAKAKTLIAQFRGNAKFQFSTGLPAEPVRDDLFQHAQGYSDSVRNDLLATVAGGRAIDGYALIRELRAGKQASAFLTQPDEAVNAAGKELMQWFERVYGQAVAPDVPGSWHPQHLEYQPCIAFSDADSRPVLLQKEEYYGDGISWHGFAPAPGNLSIPAAAPAVSTQNVIPSGVRFRGMPAARLWEMEDSQVDFGAIRAASTELSKMLFAEFGLVFSNDWLVAPLMAPCGGMSRVRSVTITDNFGKESLLPEIAPDPQWSFFQHRLSGTGQRWLFLAAGGECIQESRPVEQVSFLRDEMANMVWGVEELIADPFGGGRDGALAAQHTAQLIRSLQPEADSAGEGQDAASGWKYKAGTLMAENRIPFIPVMLETAQVQSLGKRRVVLQRAAAPRVADDFVPVRVRPRTSLLGYAGKREDEKPAPFYIFEEEVPRTGIVLSLVWKRTRWFNGQTLTWLARRKAVGKGEIDANFRFDMLKK